MPLMQIAASSGVSTPLSVAIAVEIEPTVKLFLFREIKENVSKKVFSEAERVGKFISGRDVQIEKCNHMVL